MTTRPWLDRLRRSVRALLGVTPTLDLHGFGVADALRATEGFLRRAQTLHEPVVRIVYGKGHGSPGGRGVLREVVPHWLEHEGLDLVERVRRLPDATGADGCVEVWVRPAQAEAVGRSPVGGKDER
jgi:DNA-nicking Smr family endonuclease